MSDRALQRTPPPHPAAPTKLGRTRSRATAVVGALAYLVGFADIATGMGPGMRHRLHPLTDLLPGVFAAASAVTVVSGILLLLLAHALRRGKRRAWRAAVALLTVSVVLHSVKFELIPLLMSLAVLVALIVYRAEFRALGDPTTRWLAVRAFFALAVASLVVGLLMVILLRHHVVGGPPSVVDILQEVLTGLVGFSGPLVYLPDRLNDFNDFVLTGLGLMTALTTIYLALRSPEPRPELTDADEAAMRALLQDSSDSLGYFNLRRSVLGAVPGNAKRDRWSSEPSSGPARSGRSR